MIHVNIGRPESWSDDDVKALVEWITAAVAHAYDAKVWPSPGPWKGRPLPTICWRAA